MKVAPTPIVIELKKEWFRHAYYVYFVSMLDEAHHMVYVGMTGDRAHLMARSPFYRMSGHFNQSTATDNQLIAGLRDEYGITQSDKAAMTAKLESLKITYHAYPLSPFDFKLEREDHAELRVFAERTESWLIQQLKNDASWKVHNNTISNTPDDNAAEAGSLILADWKMRISQMILSL